MIIRGVYSSTAMGHFLCFLVLLFPAVSRARLFLPPLSTAQESDDVVQVDYKNWRDAPNSFSNASFNGKTSSGREFSAFVAVLYNGLPQNFSFQLPSSKGCSLANTSSTARLHNCTYATNAGYFNDTTGECVGNLIIDGTVKQISGIRRVNFGLSDTSFIVGYIFNQSLFENKYKLLQLITGAGWLVRDGEVCINTSAKFEKLSVKFVTEKAPRTAICVALNGTLILLQVDGVEVMGSGLDLYEFSDLLKSIGCWQAVNLDGGGSSTSVYKGTVINRPTCADIPIICERAVTSITCIRTD